MAIKKQASALRTYLEDVNDGKIVAEPNTQRSYGSMSNATKDGLIMTTMDNVFGYIPPIFLTSVGVIEESEWRINDGLHRTETLRFFMNNLHRLSPSLKNGVVAYEEILKDENGNLIYDENGCRQTEKKEFDMAGKYYKDLPKELQKRFDNFNLDLIIFENCNAAQSSHLLQIYNNQASMNTQQKAITYIPKFARKIKEIVSNSELCKSQNYSDNDRAKNKLEYVLCTSVMTSFFLNEWRHSASDNSIFLNENMTMEQLNTIGDYLERLSDNVADKYENYFNIKNTHLFIGLFHRFVQLGLHDNKFFEFLDAMESGLSDKEMEVDGEMTSFTKFNSETGTTAKKTIIKKMTYLDMLMKYYFHVESEKETDEDNVDGLTAFVQKCIPNHEITDIDIEDAESLLEDYLDEYVPCTSKLNADENVPSMIAIVVYSLKDDSVDIDGWLEEYGKNNNMYDKDQYRNYRVMYSDLINYSVKHAA